MKQYERKMKSIAEQRNTWLITGVAGFIGSNLLETLLGLGQNVVGLDNFSTGFQQNLDEVRAIVSSDQWNNFKFIEGDIRNLSHCNDACQKVDYVLHQAALGSVPRSLENPIATNDTNINGFLNILVASRDANVKRLVYAASSSTYGDHPALPKIEKTIGKPLSPYAVTKLVNEQYAEVFARCYNFKTIGLRYFNIFGQRQNPDGAYAAVIPKWTAGLIQNDPIYINGDGETSRDFCHIDNAVQANLLAATGNEDASNEVYNVAVGDQTSLKKLYQLLNETLATHGIKTSSTPTYRDFRQGDVLHSKADIGKAVEQLDYFPLQTIKSGIQKTMPWYINNLVRHSG